MDKISEIKTDLLMREWAEMVRECRSSGLTVKEWCINNNYYRLKRVRNFICDNKLVNINNVRQSAHQKIYIEHIVKIKPLVIARKKFFSAILPKERNRAHYALQ